MSTRPSARIRTLRRCLAAGAALCVLTTTLSVPTSAAARERKVVVQPATGLSDQVVDVSWSGFRPTKKNGTFSVVVLQCKDDPKSVLRDCNTADTFPFSFTGNLQHATTTKNGTGHVFMDIMTTSRLPALGCSETHPCTLLVYEDDGNGYDPNGLPPNRVIVPLHFAHSFGDCPPVQNFDVRIETETSAAPALYQWAADFCTGEHAFTVDVTNSSSNSARENFFAKQIDIAVSSLKPEADEVTAASPPYTVVPLDLTAVVIAYNITDRVTHKPITDITLTPRLVARLISDSDLTTFFHDPEFLKLNPGHHWPLQAAAPGLRGERNADATIVTNWLNSNPAARSLLDGNDKYGVAVNPAWKGVQYPTDIFETRLPDGVYFPRVGEEGVAERLFAATKPAEDIPTNALNAGFFGVVDLPIAARFRLPVAKLTNGVGQPVVALSADSAQAGFHAMVRSPDGFSSVPAVVKSPAYPLMKVDQAMVPPELTHSNRDLRIRAFLDHAVTDGQDELPPGYATLPDMLKHRTLLYTGDTSLAIRPPPRPRRRPRRPPSRSTPAGTAELGLHEWIRATGATPGRTTRRARHRTRRRPPSPTPRRVTTTTAAPVAKLAGLRLPDSGDRLVLPVVLGLALLALVVRASRGHEAAARGWRLRR